MILSFPKPFLFFGNKRRNSLEQRRAYSAFGGWGILLNISAKHNNKNRKRKKETIIGAKLPNPSTYNSPQSKTQLKLIMTYAKNEATGNLLPHASLSKTVRIYHAGDIAFHLHQKSTPPALHFPQNHSPLGQLAVHPCGKHLVDDENASMPSLSWILPYLSPCRQGKLISIT